MLFTVGSDLGSTLSGMFYGIIGSFWALSLGCREGVSQVVAIGYGTSWLWQNWEDEKMTKKHEIWVIYGAILRRTMMISIHFHFYGHRTRLGEGWWTGSSWVSFQAATLVRRLAAQKAFRRKWGWIWTLFIQWGIGFLLAKTYHFPIDVEDEVPAIPVTFTLVGFCSTLYPNSLMSLIISSNRC